MLLDLSWVFSIFKVPKISRASDARNFTYFKHLWRPPCYLNRNVKCRRDYYVAFSIPPLASTSESIVKAGLNNIWRTKSKAPSHGYVPFVPLQKANEQQPEQGIIHSPAHPTSLPRRKASRVPPSKIAPIPTHPQVPFPQTDQYIPAEHPRARLISPHQKAVNRKPAKGTESTQRKVGLDLFYSSLLSSLPFTLFDFQPPDAVSSSPSKSLLFRPPSPPPKRPTVFNSEEDTVPLPPAPEPKTRSNPFGTTYPVRSPEHEFPIKTLPSSSLPTGNVHPLVPIHIPDQKSQDQTVPFSSHFPTQSFNTRALSPLPISLSFPPVAAPPPPELVIKLAGPDGYLNADHHKSQIIPFLSSRAAEVANSLVVIWQLSHIDSGGRRGLESLKALFAQLDEEVLDSDRTALSRFSKISITIPDQIKNVALYNYLPQPVKEDVGIDLANAMNLHEFIWHGDFVIFASKFKNLSFATLTSLKIKSSHISIQDAITLLHSCSGLQTVGLGIIQSEEDSDATISLKSSGVTGVERKALPNLTHLALDSDVALHPLIRRFCWTAQVSLSLTLRKQGTASLVQALDSGS